MPASTTSSGRPARSRKRSISWWSLAPMDGSACTAPSRASAPSTSPSARRRSASMSTQSGSISAPAAPGHLLHRLDEVAAAVVEAPEPDADLGEVAQRARPRLRQPEPGRRGQLLDVEALRLRVGLHRARLVTHEVADHAPVPEHDRLHLEVAAGLRQLEPLPQELVGAVVVAAHVGRWRRAGSTSVPARSPRCPAMSMACARCAASSATSMSPWSASNHATPMSTRRNVTPPARSAIGSARASRTRSVS